VCYIINRLFNCLTSEIRIFKIAFLSTLENVETFEPDKISHVKTIFKNGTDPNRSIAYLTKNFLVQQSKDFRAKCHFFHSREPQTYGQWAVGYPCLSTAKVHQLLLCRQPIQITKTACVGIPWWNNALSSSKKTKVICLDKLNIFYRSTNNKETSSHGKNKKSGVNWRPRLLERFQQKWIQVTNQVLLEIILMMLVQFSYFCRFFNDFNQLARTMPLEYVVYYLNLNAISQLLFTWNGKHKIYNYFISL